MRTFLFFNNIRDLSSIDLLMITSELKDTIDTLIAYNNAGTVQYSDLIIALTLSTVKGKCIY